MKSFFRRMTTMALALAMCLLLLPAVGEAVTVDKIDVAADGTFKEVGGSVEMQLYITNKGDAPVTLAHIVPANTCNVLAKVDSVNGNTTIEPKETSWILVTASVIGSAMQGTYSETLQLFFEEASMPKNVKVSIQKTSEPVVDPSDPDTESQIMISPVDTSGKPVPAPEGDAGKRINIRLPLMCRKGLAYDIKVTPVISTSLESFPFVIEEIDYTQSCYGTLYPNYIVEFVYNLKLSKEATNGVKQVDFKVSYRDGTNAIKECTVSVFVTVKNGMAGTATDPDALVSMPKLIIESFATSVDRIYAGDEFDITLNLKNTSSEEAIQNLQLRITDPNNVVLPANSGSNTIYIDKIAKGETKTVTMTLQTPSDAEAKTYTMNVEFSYEGSSSKHTYTPSETLTLSISQHIRTKLDALTIYDDAWVGQGVSMSFALYNLGRSSIYNCMVTVEGEGLAMEENYFGGNIPGGSQMRADFVVIPSIGGDIAGKVIITYEDVFGETITEELPFNLFVNEEQPYDPAFDPIVPDTPEDTGGAFPWWAWVIIGAAVIGAVSVLIVVLRKRRERRLEDV